MQGLLHDLSKFSPIEFFESVKYFQGDSSPIDAAKKDKGYSNAWLHHKGKNKHHFEYWQDNANNEIGWTSLEMPLKYKIEMICDYVGAGKAYYGKEFTPQKEYDWWQNKKSKPLAMHEKDKAFVDEFFEKYLLNEKDAFKELKKLR